MPEDKPLEGDVQIQWIKEYQDKCKAKEEHNAVSHPAHYTQGGIECIEAIKASMTTLEFQGYLKGNAEKYLWRWRNKGGVEDLRKARVYLDWLIKTIDGAER